MSKIRHEFASQQEAMSFGHSEVSAAQTAADDTVTSGKVTLAGLGEDVAGSEDLISKNTIEYQRAVEYSDLAQIDVRTDTEADNIQQSTASQVAARFRNA